MKKGTAPVFEVIVATHKPYPMPTDPLYQPLLVGSDFFPQDRLSNLLPQSKPTQTPSVSPFPTFTLDNIGKNISTKNPNYSELTGLYWLWQNYAKTDPHPDSFYGLVHYRRFLASPPAPFTPLRSTIKVLLSFLAPHHQDSSRSTPPAYFLNPAFTNSKYLNLSKFKQILNLNTLKALLYDQEKNIKYDIILPKKRNYLVESLYSHYQHTLHIEPLDLTRKIIKQHHPAFLTEFDRLKIRRTAHMFNIFILRKDLFNQYCTFLFDILFTLEKSLSQSQLTQYDEFHARFFGRISELLLDVFLYTKYPDLDQRANVLELKVLELEPVNWHHKITNFLLAKFFGKKYHKSN